MSLYGTPVDENWQPLRKPRPLLVGRGPWGQNIARTLEELKVDYTLCGSMTADDALAHAKVRGNTHIIIATPLSTHARLVLTTWMQSRLNDEPLLPVFVEKPACSTAEELNQLYTFWLTQGQPKFLCNSIHLFTRSIESYRESFKNCGPPEEVLAHFGGPGPVRADCSDLWDYGWHALSLMYAIGVPLDDWKVSEINPWYCCRKVNPRHFLAACNQWPSKTATVQIGLRGLYNGHQLDPRDPPPLKRALQLFLSDEHDWKNDYRFGFELPLAVTRVLEHLCPCKAA